LLHHPGALLLLQHAYSLPINDGINRPIARKRRDVAARSAVSGCGNFNA
jgi:hypothetical protein